MVMLLALLIYSSHIISVFKGSKWLLESCNLGVIALIALQGRQDHVTAVVLHNELVVDLVTLVIIASKPHFEIKFEFLIN